MYGISLQTGSPDNTNIGQINFCPFSIFRKNLVLNSPRKVEQFIDFCYWWTMPDLLRWWGVHSPCLPAFCRPPFVCSEPTFSSVQLLATHINQKSHHKGDFSVLLVVQRSLFREKYTKIIPWFLIIIKKMTRYYYYYNLVPLKKWINNIWQNDFFLSLVSLLC